MGGVPWREPRPWWWHVRGRGGGAPPPPPRECGPPREAQDEEAPGSLESEGHGLAGVPDMVGGECTPLRKGAKGRGKKSNEKIIEETQPIPVDGLTEAVHIAQLLSICIWIIYQCMKTYACTCG